MLRQQDLRQGNQPGLQTMQHAYWNGVKSATPRVWLGYLENRIPHNLPGLTSNSAAESAAGADQQIQRFRFTHVSHVRAPGPVYGYRTITSSYQKTEPRPSQRINHMSIPYII